VPWSRSPSRCSALVISARTSFTEAVTAESCTNALEVNRAISRATEVFPVPGGPQKITDESRSDSMSARRGLPGPSRCC
jgi:hypothetical protein